MLNIKILTFVKVNNFGAHLQLYALSKILKTMGHTVHVFNFKLKTKKISLPGRLAQIVSTFHFYCFRKKFLPYFTKECNTPKELANATKNSDFCIVGSDQVWNAELTKNDEHIFFFNFLPDKVKRIAYAASFGSPEWKGTDLQTTKALLTKFTAISVREKSGAKICKEKFELEANVVLDPTLLIESYDELKIKKHKTNELIYFKFLSNAKIEKDVKRIAEQLKLRPVALNANRLKKGFIYRPFPSVRGWLSSIKNAELVITDSFHCMAFAILFHRPFIVLPGHGKRYTRIINLLTELGIENRFLINPDDLFTSKLWHSSINYKNVDANLVVLRKKSIHFLEQSLKKQ
ncbi:Polysaccharide pyruvyl transferase [Mariniphaga anaerophila]|uniref:Polysaccharide pyruvyl transferase n=1 Tax=Mariniphaga anaerophila TaxID=1484053 RepID=A0A1M4VKT1_9BACT|nr:polysaccharide pyruvyl transferase family protein [Mariniphaga anaerophila]SHE69631.1 Polysaccharide pyruvyl transferase [Mariniphaga anaerophila]